VQYIDAFNGDADGLCALVQLRRNNPVASTLITGIKRDINLLKRIENGANTYITVLDISFEKNARDVERLLQAGAEISYVDHHQTGVITRHPNLKTDINLSADTCTSLIVDAQLKGKYRAWAITAAFGDNLADKAMTLGSETGFNLDELALLKELGTYLNYNGYGASLDDLFFDPAILYQRLVKFDSPLEFIEQDPEIFTTLKTGYHHDMEKAEACPIIYATDSATVIELPNEKWARRVSGVLGNDLANRNPDKAHAIITDKGDSTYLVSVRAPLTRKSGADTLVSQFPTGGGRKAAAGINALPKQLLTAFIEEFERTYQLT
jgi:hypothetical protein